MTVTNSFRIWVCVRSGVMVLRLLKKFDNLEDKQHGIEYQNRVLGVIADRICDQLAIDLGDKSAQCAITVYDISDKTPRNIVFDDHNRGVNRLVVNGVTCRKCEYLAVLECCKHPCP